MSNAPETPVRSPSYPVWALADAVTAVRKIEAQYRSSNIDREIAAKIIGYSGLSGPANKALAALAQFGLVERAGKGEMRVTARARAILHPESDGEKQAELRAAALEPQLFRDLQERWPNMIPPEEGVIMHLNRKGFNQSAIRPAAKAYLETLLFLEEAGGSESHGNESGEGAGTGVVEQPQPDGAKQMNTTFSPAPAIAPPTLVATPALNRVNMNITGNRVQINALLDINGLRALEKKIQALKVLLEANEDMLDDEAEENDPLLA